MLIEAAIKTRSASMLYAAVLQLWNHKKNNSWKNILIR